ncbi:MAG: GtrA family protein, partial [Mesorhizobium sp.]
AGNLLALDAFLGSDADARVIVESHHVGLVAVCRGSVESQLLAEKAPKGFLAGLIDGRVPEWLEPVAASRGAPIELYRVREGG